MGFFFENFLLVKKKSKIILNNFFFLFFFFHQQKMPSFFHYKARVAAANPPTNPFQIIPNDVLETRLSEVKKFKRHVQTGLRTVGFKITRCPCFGIGCGKMSKAADIFAIINFPEMRRGCCVTIRQTNRLEALKKLLIAQRESGSGEVKKTRRKILMCERNIMRRAKRTTIITSDKIEKFQVRIANMIESI